MTIKEIQQKYFQALSKIYTNGEVEAITNIIFEHFLNFDRNKKVVTQNELVEESKNKLLNIALKRLLTYEPVQYIVEHAWFYSIKYRVNKDVLIPRPETEELVHEAILFLKNNERKHVIDIGTGSGCIPITIKKNIVDANITAIDVSKNALAIANENAIENNVVINFIELNFLEENNFEQFQKFDLIISNPPYIPATEKLEDNVAQYEPHVALFVPKNDPLIFYKKILLFANNHLEKNGKIMLEAHENFAKETAALFTQQKYVVDIKKDMQGKERMLIIYQNQ